MRKKKNNNFLFFSKKEKNGSLYFMIIILLLVSCPILFALFKKDKIFNQKKYSNEIQQLLKQKKDSSRTQGYYNEQSRTSFKSQWKSYDSESRFRPTKKSERFIFNPNTATPDEWMRMGVSKKTTATIQKYISKGGRFKSAEDLKKIWGLPPTLVEELMPYVKIQPEEKFSAEEPPAFSSNSKPDYPPKSISAVDVNTADSALWVALPAIGPTLTHRILSYREKLGGFHSIGQVREVFGISDSSFEIISPYLRIENTEVKKININTASLDELKVHPYIRYRLANAIVEYRNQHGAYSSVASLKKIMLITDEVLMKIAPYVSVQ